MTKNTGTCKTVIHMRCVSFHLQPANYNKAHILSQEGVAMDTTVCGCDGLYLLGPGSGTIRRCSPVGVSMALME